MYRPSPDQIGDIPYTLFKEIHDAHWLIESFHRTIKQVANVERFQVRQTVAISNHIFAAISAFVHLQLQCIHKLITNCYSLKRNLFNDVIRSFILDNLATPFPVKK